MTKEIELKILEVDPKEVRRNLNRIGAKLIGKYNFKRLVFNVLNTKGRHLWLRLRTDGKDTTLTLKDNKGKDLLSTDELEVSVSDFKIAAKILSAAFKNILYEENKREEYTLGKAHITIDFLPFLKPYVEIEAESPDNVLSIFKKLKIKGKPFGNAPASEVYKLYGMDYKKVAGRNYEKLKRLLYT